MASFVSRKKQFGQREKNVPKIKSLLFENSFNTIDNRRNNTILYKVKSRHLVQSRNQEFFRAGGFSSN